jgi:hypothetical protein
MMKESTNQKTVSFLNLPSATDIDSHSCSDHAHILWNYTSSNNYRVSRSIGIDEYYKRSAGFSFVSLSLEDFSTTFFIKKQNHY